MEAEADTYMLLGIDAKRDPLPRFYAGWLRELTRENDSFEWLDKYDPRAVAAVKERWQSVLDIAPRLGFKVEYGAGARMFRLVGCLPTSIATTRRQVSTIYFRSIIGPWEYFRRPIAELANCFRRGRWCTLVD